MSSRETDLAPAVELREVVLRRGNVTALDHVTVALPRHRTTAILGASGSGKSTLVQLVIGLIAPDSGTVTTLGEKVNGRGLRRLRKRIGYAIQDVALLPHLSARANILLPATLDERDVAQSEARLSELMAFMRLQPQILDRYPHELSGGQQQRAGLCRAMMLRPELLLLDEPFSGLDTMTRRAIHEEFLNLQHVEPVSTVIVTHDPQEAVALASHLVILRSGRVQQFGPTNEVMSNPANEYVRRLCTALGQDAV